MTDIVKGVLGGSWALVTGWILPAALGIVLFGFLVLPSVDQYALFTDISGAAPAQKGVALLISAAVLGLALSAVATPLYRVLEGYAAWPKPRRERRIRHYQQLRAHLGEQLRVANRTGSLSVQDALALEELKRYPDSDAQVAPTKLGNGIRRFEFYAQDRYQLDSQLFWNHLRAVAPEAAVKEVDAARAGVDFFVCLMYVSVLLGLSALLAVISPGRQWPQLLIALVLAVAVPFAAYPAAVAATDAWSSAVIAMVDLGRVPLARALGLRLPDTLEEERAMWQVMGWQVGFAYDQKTPDYVNVYRLHKEPAVKPPADGAGGDSPSPQRSDGPSPPPCL